MAELIVVGFKGIHRASEVLAEVQRLDADWPEELRAAVAVYRSADGQLRVDQGEQPTVKEGAVAGGLAGGVIGGMLLALAGPITGGATLPAAAAAMIGVHSVGLGVATGVLIDAATLRQDYGITEEFLNRTGELVKPGQSALFVLVRATDPQLVDQRICKFGGEMIRTIVVSDDAKEIHEALPAQGNPLKH